MKLISTAGGVFWDEREAGMAAILMSNAVIEMDLHPGVAISATRRNLQKSSQTQTDAPMESGIDQGSKIQNWYTPNNLTITLLAS